MITIMIEDDGSREVSIGDIHPAEAAYHLFHASEAVGLELQDFSVSAISPVMPRDWRDL